MSPLKIVLLMVDPPLPFGRAMGRWYYPLLKGLVGLGHRVSAFATCNSDAEAEEARSLFPGPEYDLRCYPPGPQPRGSRLESLRRPYSYVFGSALREEIEAELAAGFDVLHLETLWSGWLGLAHRRRSVLAIPYLYGLDLADQPTRSLRERALRVATYGAERRLLRSYPNLIAVSPRLAATIRGIAPGADVQTIPFGLDTSLYPMLGEDRGDRDPTIGLIASFNWTPGLTAGRRLLDRLWPEIRRRAPRVRLHIGGVHAQTAFAEHRGQPGVTIEDRIDDVPGFFRGIDVQLYTPNHSSGMKFKVLESFAYGIPVVTTADGVEGIPAVDGVHAGICEDDAGLIDRTLALLEDGGRRARYRAAARALVESHCNPRASLEAVERAYEGVLGVPAVGAR